ncbi:MAG: carboxypeptidase M32 [Oscillospiraceae bacterium]|jgi:carboxypeptidase Taq|nr:carboxypeptidase M32 [Oscillospiraceae bacterium]
MTKEQALSLIAQKREAIRALNMASALMHWDAATSGVPEKSLTARSAAVGWLGGEAFGRFIAEDTLQAIETLEGVLDRLDERERAMVREMGRKYRKIKAVPTEEMKEYRALTAQAEPIWEKAREKNDFAMIQPYYEKIFDFQRRLCDWFGYQKHPYDALLDDYEKGATVEMLDGFFAQLREEIAPLVKMIGQRGSAPREIKGAFPIAKQRGLTPWLYSFVGFDASRGKVGEVAHPFCITISRDDVRITTKYHEDDLLSSLYSVIHEAGHGLYEQNMDASLESYGLDDCASMGMHESQSRLYENMIGRSRAFAGVLLPKLRELFDGFGDWDAETLFRAINIARPSLVRIEADELTYCLHIIVRYELEKALLAGEIKVCDLPGLWADKYEELLGVRPPDNAKGVLQDVHWSAGLVGYFPSYAVGNAYAAQIMQAMRKTVDVDGAVGKGNLAPVEAWLCENIHRHGELYRPDELLRRATGEGFNPAYYVAYLKEKFTELYK